MLKLLLCAGAGALVYKLGHAAGRLDAQLEAFHAAAETAAKYLTGEGR